MARGYVLKRALTSSNQCDRVAFGQETLRSRASDSARRAGDYDFFVFGVFIHIRLVFSERVYLTGGVE